LPILEVKQLSVSIMIITGPVIPSNISAISWLPPLQWREQKYP